MVQLQREAVEHAQHCPVPLTAPSNGRMQCLVVAADDKRRRELADSATSSGWRAFQSACLDDVLACTRRLKLQLAIIDLGLGQSTPPEWLRLVVENLAAHSDTLTVVCGGACQPEEEIWARQLGVWIYAPGVVEPLELQPILGEARDIAGRLIESRGSAMSGAAFG